MSSEQEIKEVMAPFFEDINEEFALYYDELLKQDRIEPQDESGKLLLEEFFLRGASITFQKLDEGITEMLDSGMLEN